MIVCQFNGRVLLLIGLAAVLAGAGSQPAEVVALQFRDQPLSEPMQRMQDADELARQVNEGWRYRRGIDVIWDTDRAGGHELCEVEFYIPMEVQRDPAGGDVRVTTEAGQAVPSRVLMSGPGDQVRVLFKLIKPVRRYYVWFDHPAAPPPADGMDEIVYEAGLHMEMRQWMGGPVDSFAQIEAAWELSEQVIGRRMIDQPFLGYNPFGDEDRTISKITGSLFAPIDGDYTFAAAADDRGALYINGEPLVFARSAPGDTRHNATIPLRRGRHEFVFYHVNTGGEGRFSVGWKRPDMAEFQVIPRFSFGICSRGIVGPLEETASPLGGRGGVRGESPEADVSPSPIPSLRGRGVKLVADFKLEHRGECFIAGSYLHRVRLTAHEPAGLSAPVQFEWDFGDGQTATGQTVEHVFLSEGVYPVKLTASAGDQRSTMTTRISIARNLRDPARPPEDQPPVQSRIVATYDASQIHPDHLPRALRLHQRDEAIEPMGAVAMQLAGGREHENPVEAMEALREATKAMLNAGDVDTALRVWEQVPQQSSLQPQADAVHAGLLLWWKADPAPAVERLKPHAESGDADVRRVYAQALVLAGEAEAGGEILRQLPVHGDPMRRPALAGAMARSIEHFIREEDAEAAEEQWDRWQAQYPADFLNGHSIYLRVQMLELRKRPEAAARLAEAFAAAVPASPYAPRLLHRAAEVLADMDVARSDVLRQRLRELYPEDPLSGS